MRFSNLKFYNYQYDANDMLIHITTVKYLQQLKISARL